MASVDRVLCSGTGYPPRINGSKVPQGLPSPEKPAIAETSEPGRDAPKRKLSYLEQREWDGMEARILEAEQQLSARQRELQEAASGGKGLSEAYEKVQEAQGLIEDLYARWAELEVKVPR